MNRATLVRLRDTAKQLGFQDDVERWQRELDEFDKLNAHK